MYGSIQLARYIIIIIIIMYIYRALINAMSTHIIHINLNMTFCTYREAGDVRCPRAEAGVVFLRVGLLGGVPPGMWTYRIWTYRMYRYGSWPSAGSSGYKCLAVAGTDCGVSAVDVHRPDMSPQLRSTHNLCQVSLRASNIHTSCSSERLIPLKGPFNRPRSGPCYNYRRVKIVIN